MQVTQAVKIQYHTIQYTLYCTNTISVRSIVIVFVSAGADDPFLPNLGNYEGNYEGTYHWIITPLIYSWEKGFAGEATLVSTYHTDKLVNKISAPLPSTPLHSPPLFC